jgi:hypothetical protein
MASMTTNMMKDIMNTMANMGRVNRSENLDRKAL